MRIIWLLGFTVLASGVVAGNMDAVISAEDILDRMEVAYASARTYTDSGVVTVEHLAGDRSWTKHQPFSTAFVRGGGFRFEFWDHTAPASSVSKDESVAPPEHYVVWYDGINIQSWWSIRPGVKRHPTVEYALAGATGVSYGSATRVPGLLMPEMHWGSPLRNLTQPRLLGEDTVDGTVCYKLTATVPFSSYGNTRTLWIDRESYLIRKVEWKESSGGPGVVTIKPSLNVNVPPETFAFDPDTASE